MRSFTLLYLAISTSLVLAAPRPAPVPQGDYAIDLTPESGDLGPGPGTPTPPAEVAEEVQVQKALSEVNKSHSPGKRGIEKRVVVPAGYFITFENLNGATEHTSYKTYVELSGPNPQECTDFCDANPGCAFANMFQEHTASGTLHKCSIYSMESGAASATNVGQWRDGFHITISDSYGFAKRFTPNVPGWSSEALTGAINGKRASPTDPDPYMGYASIAECDPNLCAAVCEEKTKFNSVHNVNNGKFRACNFFNFYKFYKNGEGFKTICSFYLIPFDNTFATNHGYSSNGDTYTIVDSYGFTRDTQQGTGGLVTV